MLVDMDPASNHDPDEFFARESELRGARFGCCDHCAGWENGHDRPCELCLPGDIGRQRFPA